MLSLLSVSAGVVSGSAVVAGVSSASCVGVGVSVS